MSAGLKMPGSFTSAEALFAVIDAKDHATRDAAVRNAALREAIDACEEVERTLEGDPAEQMGAWRCREAICAMFAAAPSADAEEKS